ncbi:hypothetical protein SUGI_0625970 [Cryptomeria japonica]|nr:hypothetical protein SUGI_0625970 [Cryptomeria japonica]
MVALFVVQSRFKSPLGPKRYVNIPACAAHGFSFLLACAARGLLSDPHGFFMPGSSVLGSRWSLSSTGSWSVRGSALLVSKIQG